MDTGPIGPSWLSTWQAICEQEAQSKIRYKKFMEEWYRIETKMKLMDLRVDAMLRMRDEYLTHLFQKYPNWKPTFTSFGLRSSTQTADYQSDLYRLMESEIQRSLRQRDTEFQMQHPTFSQAMGTSMAGPLLPTYYYNMMAQRPMAPSYGLGNAQMAMAPYMASHEGTASSSYHPAPTAEMAELKTEMAQIKSRLEDITHYLRDLRHSAIELTTSVSRRSSMRDKDRRRVPVFEQSGEEVNGAKSSFVRGGAAAGMGIERNVRVDERRPDSFVDQVSRRLVQEKRERNVQVRYQDDEDDQGSDVSYRQKEPPRPVKPKQEPKPAAPSVPKTMPVVADDDFDSEPEKPISRGPRFDFSSAPQKAPEAPKPTPAPAQPPPPPPPKVESEEETTESESPPATATWLMTGEKPKSAPPAVREQKPGPKAAQLDMPPAKRPPAADSSPNSSPEIKPKSQPQSASTGYQALLGAVSKGQGAPKAKVSPMAALGKSDGSDSDDLDNALAVGKSSASTVAKEAPPRPRDASLSDIFSFGKSDSGKKSESILKSPEKPKTAPAVSFGAASAVKQSEPAAAPKKSAPAAEPDDFLKKLFPDKFAAQSGGGAGKAAGAAADAGRKKKPAFFMGDDSDDDDIDLPQGNKKSDDLDDDFFFR